MPSENEARSATAAFLIERWQQLMKEAEYMVPGAAEAMNAVTTAPMTADNILQQANIHPWLDVARYGQGDDDVDRGVVGYYIDSIVKMLFGMPGSTQIRVPFWWKSRTQYGRLWNAAYVRANADDMISLVEAVEIIKKARPKFNMQSLNGYIHRARIETWPNPQAKQTGKHGRLVSRKQILELTAELAAKT